MSNLIANVIAMNHPLTAGTASPLKTKLLMAFFLFLAITFSVTAVGQNGVWKNGKVTDSITGKPIVGATINAPGEYKSVTSDSAGMFRLFFLHGPYIEVSSPGYHSKSLGGGWSISNLDIQLVPLDKKIQKESRKTTKQKKTLKTKSVNM